MAAALAALLLVTGCSPVAASGVEVRMRYSRFEPAEIHVQHGRTVTFRLRNDDPIDHEWIVGDAATHAAHRDGTEPQHDSRPTEVSIPARGSTTTTVTFPNAGRFTFICHLPGHEAYGMVGTLIVD
jgi:uncharacterized cupredoxin-like copper-binding protein